MDRDSEWRRIRQIEGVLGEAIMSFSQRRCGTSVLREAAREFVLAEEFELDQPHFTQLFLPWLFYSWLPTARKQRSGSREERALPLALQYLRALPDVTSDYEQRFISAACQAPTTFFLVNHSDPGQSLDLRDLLLGREFTVKEASGSRVLKRGDLAYGRVVPLEGQAIFVGMAPLVIPAHFHLRILDFRDELRQLARESHRPLDLDWLLDSDDLIREYYQVLAHTILNPPPPQLQNTDGDPFVFVRLKYDLLGSPETALEKLKPLTLAVNESTILEHAEYDAAGRLLKAAFPWMAPGNMMHKSWKNTVLGNITLERNRLEIEVNSEKRAHQIRLEIEKRLGQGAILKETEKESVADIKRTASGPREASSAGPGSEEDLSSLPEVQEMLRRQMAAHWEAWIDEPIPALKNRTPRQAVRDPAGRERLEALLLEFERRNGDLPQPELRVDIGALRLRLGL